MVVLNIYSKIKPICISSKLGIYISNLPSEKHNNWKDELIKEINSANKKRLDNYKKYNLEEKFSIENFYKKIFLKDELLQDVNEEILIREIVDNMICIYFDYNYDDMPLGGWETNCFDGRFCEEDYAEKVVNFINFLSYGKQFDDFKNTPQWIYSSNSDEISPYRMFLNNNNSKETIKTLKKWGRIFDDFLQDRNDYLKLDYLINALEEDGIYNEYHYFKLFSICQLLLENKKEIELDKKLPQFINDKYTVQEKNDIANTLRRMRNKIAHGDFIALENIIEEFAVNFMDGKFSFDYSEYSRKNWVLLHTCCLLNDIIINIIKMMFFQKDKLLEVKKST